MNLKALKKLRENFLQASSALKKDYWNEELLEVYAQTLGERIRWKWAHVGEHLREQKIDPASLFPQDAFFIEDFACGPGTASVEFGKILPSSTEFFASDRSKVAESYARKRIENEFPDWKFSTSAQKNKKIILISYLINELDHKMLKSIEAKIHQFDLFIWLDAGSHDVSRKLSEVRDRLRGTFHFLAPCPHQKSCPILAAENARHWCHTFAPAPQHVFHSREWAQAARLLGFDLRSLPFHYIYGVNKVNLSTLTNQSHPPHLIASQATPERKRLVCNADGVLTQS